MRRSIHGSNLRGDGYSLDRISAQLRLDNLHVDFNNRDLLSVEPIRGELAGGTFRINSFQIGSPSLAASPRGAGNDDSTATNQSHNGASPDYHQMGRHARLDRLGWGFGVRF